jgi:hypothetical protein
VRSAEYDILLANQGARDAGKARHTGSFGKDVQIACGPDPAPSGQSGGFGGKPTADKIRLPRGLEGLKQPVIDREQGIQRAANANFEVLRHAVGTAEQDGE